MDAALDAGINFIDTAEMYAVPPRAETAGSTEEIVGQWLRERGCRERIVLATKVAGPSDMSWLRDGERTRLTKEQIIRAAEGSLRRLGVDCIDLYQTHWPDRNTNFFGRPYYQHQEREDSVPLQETLEALGQLRDEGKIRHVGLSNETPWGLAQCLRLAERDGLMRMMAVQNPYNLLNRMYEIGMAEISARASCGLLAYSPLAFGVLSGKYMDGARPEGARLTRWAHFQRYESELGRAATAEFVGLARRHDIAPAVMAIAFVLRQPFTTSCIIGATTMEQLRENISAAAVQLDDALVQELEAISTRHPLPCP